MKFFLLLFIIVINKFNNADAIKCCHPVRVYFTAVEPRICANYTNAEKRYTYGDPRFCETKICKDGKNHEHCSKGKCECFLGVNCKDTADKCYDTYDTFDQAFSQGWAKKYGVIQDFSVDL